ncbi:phosphoglycerate dehydrogenase [Microlunatus sp. GCM10028923]|uniref:phosphoglycerate dehydrogenase n=1 Tax=Microlunatus sp. GCM10028923 TaxID=3273400 RepID=UPI0036108732
MSTGPNSQTVLITTAYLRPGDEISRNLERIGCAVEHAPDLDLLEPGERDRLIARADAIIAGTRPLTAEHLAQARRLRVIVRTGVGFDSVDIAAATRLGIPVCVTPGVNRRAVAEHVFALALAHSRNIVGSAAQLSVGEWHQPTGRELAGRTLGIVGLGSIGREVARIATAFDLNVIAHDPHLDHEYARSRGIESACLSDLLRRADIVTLHLYLNDETRNLINAQALATMRSHALIINTARGGLVDEAALAAAVRSGTIGGAAVDVFAEEPPPPTSPLRGVDGILMTSHIAGATLEARATASAMAAETVIAALGGSVPPNLVNPDYARRAAS